MIADGDKTKLETMLKYLRVGPPAAEVKEVVTEWTEYKGQFVEFEIRV